MGTEGLAPIGLRASAGVGHRLSFLGALLLVLGVSFSSGCTALQWYARQTGKGAVQGFYEGMSGIDGTLQRQVTSQLLSDPAVRQVARDVTAAVVLGAVDGLSQAKLDALSGNLIQSTLRTLREEGNTAVTQLVRETSPLIEEAMRRGIEQSMQALGGALRKTAQEDLGAATTLLVRAAVDGAMQSLQKAGRELGHELDEHTEQYLKQKVAPGVGHIARTLTREAILGMEEGLIESGAKNQMPALRLVMHEIGLGLGEGLGVGFGRSVHKSPIEPILIGIAITLGLLLAAALAGVIVLWRRYLSTSKSLALYAHEIDEAEGIDAAHAQDLRRAIRDAHATANHAAFLDKFLKHRGLYRPTDLSRSRIPPVYPGSGVRSSSPDGSGPSAESAEPSSYLPSRISHGPNGMRGDGPSRPTRKEQP